MYILYIDDKRLKFELSRFNWLYFDFSWNGLNEYWSLLKCLSPYWEENKKINPPIVTESTKKFPDDPEIRHDVNQFDGKCIPMDSENQLYFTVLLSSWPSELRTEPGYQFCSIFSPYRFNCLMFNKCSVIIFRFYRFCCLKFGSNTYEKFHGKKSLTP